MTMIHRRLLAAISLILLSAASQATEPDQRALELALSLADRAPTAAHKSAAFHAAAAQAAQTTQGTQAAVAAELARLIGGTQQQGEK